MPSQSLSIQKNPLSPLSSAGYPLVVPLLDSVLFILQPGGALAGALDLLIAEQVGEVYPEAPTVPSAIRLHI